MNFSVPLYPLFSGEACKQETYIALARRVGNEMFENFKANKANKALHEMVMVPKVDNEKLVWSAPRMTLIDRTVIDLADNGWGVKLKASKPYKEIENEEDRNKLFDAIQKIVDLAQSYFPEHLPWTVDSAFKVNRTGYWMALKKDEDGQIISIQSFEV